jgi:hypothetical protein
MKPFMEFGDPWFLSDKGITVGEKVVWSHCPRFIPSAGMGWAARTIQSRHSYYSVIFLAVFLTCTPNDLCSQERCRTSDLGSPAFPWRILEFIDSGYDVAVASPPDEAGS